MAADPPNSPSREIALPVLLAEACENAEVGVSVYADDGRYVAVNEHACKLLGYDRAELLEHDVGDFSEGPIDRAALLRPGRREGIRTVRRKDGEKITVAFVATPTEVSGLAFYFTVFWELPPGDPRANGATG